MTHERNPNAEAQGGPQQDDRLPNAWERPVFADPAEALAGSAVRHFDEHDAEAIRLAVAESAARHG